MGKLLDLIRECDAPAAMVQKAARGTLALPGWERQEILVYLATSDDYEGTALADEARQVLATTGEDNVAEALSAPELPRKVAAYYLGKENLSPQLTRILAANPAVPEKLLLDFVLHSDLLQRAALLSCERVQSSRALMIAVSRDWRKAPKRRGGSAAETAVSEEDADVMRFLAENAVELGSDARELDLAHDEEDSDALFELILKACTSDEYNPDGMDELQRSSLFQKISLLRTGDKVKLALRGNRETRTLLIRDTSRLVSIAVLDSPKIGDTEVEGYAAMTGLQDWVLRGIASRKRFIKHYSVKRILANNPKMPLDVSLKLLPHLLDPDIKRLIKCKDLPETLRKVAFKVWRNRNMRTK